MSSRRIKARFKGIDSIANVQGMIYSVAQILRLLDDLGNVQDEHQEGSDGSYVEYLMKEQHGLTTEDAKQHVMDMVSDIWKDQQTVPPTNSNSILLSKDMSQRGQNGSYDVLL